MGLAQILAILIVLALWQVVVWCGCAADTCCPPVTLSELFDMIGTDRVLVRSADDHDPRRRRPRRTIGRHPVSRIRPLRIAIGALITGLQTMPSVVWFPLAILLLGLGESAIMFVVVLGAAPSVANGVLSGVDQVPPAYFRLGRVLGQKAGACTATSSFPLRCRPTSAGSTRAGRSRGVHLMAGELLVVIPGAVALGNRLAFAQEFGDAAGLLAYMLVILVVGMLADGLFSSGAHSLRRRRGLSLDG